MFVVALSTRTQCMANSQAGPCAQQSHHSQATLSCTESHRIQAGLADDVDVALLDVFVELVCCVLWHGRQSLQSHP